MDRRRFLLTSLAGALAAPLTAEAQQHDRTQPRIGVLMFNPMARDFQEGFLENLRDHGYIDGQNILVEWRMAAGRTDRAQALAEELVRLGVNVIVAVTTPAVQAAKNATRTIPIVMAAAGDPVGTGFVASLARPGGNITGISSIAAELSAKRIELLRELIPGLTRVALLALGASPFSKPLVDETRIATKRVGIQLQVLDVRHPQDIKTAFAAIAKERAGAVLVPTGVATPAWRTAELALQHRIPSVYFQSQFMESGGLMSFGASVSDMQRRAASYVDRILRGAKAADLPVEQPTKFELVINLKTAKALGLTMPPSLLARADQVIE